jgi:peptidoglycan hydrolase CwlO-like protein
MIDNIPIISYIVNMKDDVEKLNLIKQIEDLTKQKQFLQDKCREAGRDINELKRDNTLLSYDVATLTNRIKELENNAKR